MSVVVAVFVAVLCATTFLHAGDDSGATAERHPSPFRGEPPRVDYSSISALPPRVNTNQATRDADQRLRVVLLGNTLILRAAQFGYLETELTRLLPGKAICFRNLGWSGDTVTGTGRIEFGPGEQNRSNWQRPDEATGDYGFRKMLDQVRRERPHVVLIAYGSNVAFAGAAGLRDFRAGLARLLEALEPTGAQTVLLAPPPREIREGLVGNLQAQNRWLAEVAAHLSQVARSGGRPFVNLYQDWPDNDDVPFTDNGIHLNAHGYQQLAAVAANALSPTARPWKVRLKHDGAVVQAEGATATNGKATEFGLRWEVHDQRLPSVAASEQGAATAGTSHRLLQIDGLVAGTYVLDIDGRRTARADAQQWSNGVLIRSGPDFERLEKLRETIIRKNRLYFYGLRPQNKAYTHLFRRHERGHHEAEIDRFALLVEEAEQEIARLATPVRRIYELVRENDYPDHEVPGEAAQPDIKRELAAFHVPDGFEISLFAADPMVSKPININWDEHGRMWVATSSIYPHLQPGQVPVDRIVVLEDVDQDGHADKSTVFAEDLLIPHSVIPGNGGAYVTQSTDLLFLRDTDGDGRADEKRVLFTGFGNADVHHMIHGLRWGPGGDLYFAQSIYINSTVETPWGIRVSNGSCIWRLRPETLQLERLSQGLVNPWGLAFDRWGQSFGTDGAGGSGIAYLFPGSAHATHDYAGRALPSLNPGRPKECGLEVLSGRHLPAGWQDTLMSNDFRANRVTRYELRESGSGYAAEFLGDMVWSEHRGFRPVDVKMGPDGAIYIVDWYNLIIDHGEVDFHHPLRDKQHGRIWRLAAKRSVTVERPRLAGAPTSELLDMLRLPEQWTRDQARRLLRERGAKAVLPELRAWLGDTERPLQEGDLLEALWVYQGLRSPAPELLHTLLRAQDHRVRAAAVRVLADWRNRVPDTMSLLRVAVTDEHPRVRLEAVNALRTIGTREAVEVALQAADHPLDRELDFALFRTARELRDVWLAEFLEGKRMFAGLPHRIAFALSAVGGAAPLGPLVKLLREQQLDGAQLVDVLVVLASHGKPTHGAVVMEQLAGLPAEGKQRVLEAFLQSPRDRRPANMAAVARLLDDDDELVRHHAIHLAGRWRLTAAVPTLQQRAAAVEIANSERLAASVSLAEIDSESALQTLRGLYESAENPAVRATALAGLARISAEETAVQAASMLAKTDDESVTVIVADAFLGQRDGPQQLTRALRGVRLAAKTAQQLIDRLRLSGSEHPALEAAVRSAGQLPGSPQDLNVDQITKILQDVPSQGDPARGAAVFRRERLQCLSCHAVQGQGGKVGPDLSSLGGSARLGDILQSLISPSASIKEGYQTTQLVTVDGRLLSGIVQQQTEDHVRIRDAQGVLQTIPMEEIDEIVASRLSMMPTGLTEVLTREELVDLVRYLSELGRNTAAPR